MTIVVTTAAKIAALDGLLGAIDGGSGDSSGDFNLLTSGDSQLVAVPFANPAFNGAADIGGGVVEAAADCTPALESGVPTAGTIGKGEFRNRSNTALISFEITADLDIADPVIDVGSTSVVVSALSVGIDFA